MESNILFNRFLDDLSAISSLLSSEGIQLAQFSLPGSKAHADAWLLSGHVYIVLHCKTV